MTTVEFQVHYLKKRFPLAISRGVYEGGDNLFIKLTDEAGRSGWGEMAPGDTEGADTVEQGRAMLEGYVANGFDLMSIHDNWDKANTGNVAPCALAALDMASWDLLAKQADMPLYRLLGLPRRSVPTSVTVGINPPDVVRERVPLLLDDTGVKALKIKLGSPEGMEADKAMFAAVLESSAGYDVTLRVDANGGWTLDEARQMMAWLAERGVEYIEQPLKHGDEEGLAALFSDRPLPIFVDESCSMASDIPDFADRVDGVNLKLMKCGGITEALRIVATARAFGLKTMIGCMGESSISIAAGASIAALFDYVDLDSHLNLAPDPATGAPMTDGIVLPDELPGHGGRLKGIQDA